MIYPIVSFEVYYRVVRSESGVISALQWAVALKVPERQIFQRLG